MKKLNYNEILAQRYTPEEAKKQKRFPISLILDNIRSAYNVGSIFRTADSTLLESIHLCGFTPHPPREDLNKTALGSIDSIDWYYHKNTLDAIKYEKEQGKKIFALEITNQKRFYDTVQLSEFPIALVLGNELAGINEQVLEHCDEAIEIPMYGHKHSLNVSVSTGVAVYQLIQTYNNFISKKN